MAVSSEEIGRRLREGYMTTLAERVVAPDTAWYLSFTDPDIAATIPEDEQRPGGPSWIGACFVVASDFMSAVGAAHLYGCNPGGQASGWGPMPAAIIRPEYLNRLLRSENEIEAAGVEDH